MENLLMREDLVWVVKNVWEREGEESTSFQLTER